jgi:nicotinamidase-related amidase
MLIVGLGAEAGIVPSVTHAASMGYNAFAVEDCIVPSDPAWRDLAFKFMGRFATIKTRKEIIDVWNKSTPRPLVAPTAAAAGARGSGGRPAPDMREILDPKHTVLLVHEMLNGFTMRGGASDKAGRRIDADAILEPMAKLIETARSKRVRVAYVRWTTYADGSTSANAGSRPPTPVSTRTDSTIEGTWGWQIADPVKPAEGDWVLRKYRPDAFFATPLDTLMRWNGMKTLVIVGIGAEVGVVPTLMTASNLGYRRVAVSDLLRPSDPKRMEDAMRFIGDQAILKTSAEVMDIWRSASPTPSQ